MRLRNFKSQLLIDLSDTFITTSICQGVLIDPGNYLKPASKFDVTSLVVASQ